MTPNPDHMPPLPDAIAATLRTLGQDGSGEAARELIARLEAQSAAVRAALAEGRVANAARAHAALAGLQAAQRLIAQAWADLHGCMLVT